MLVHQRVIIKKIEKHIDLPTLQFDTVAMQFVNLTTLPMFAVSDNPLLVQLPVG